MNDRTAENDLCPHDVNRSNENCRICDADELARVRRGEFSSSNPLLQRLRLIANPNADYYPPGMMLLAREAVEEIERLQLIIKGKTFVIGDESCGNCDNQEPCRNQYGICSRQGGRPHGAVETAPTHNLRPLDDVLTCEECGARGGRHWSDCSAVERAAHHETECSLCASGMNSFTDPNTGKIMHARNGAVVPCSAEKAEVQRLPGESEQHARERLAWEIHGPFGAPEKTKACPDPNCSDGYVPSQPDGEPVPCIRCHPKAAADVETHQCAYQWREKTDRFECTCGAFIGSSPRGESL